MSLSNEEPQLLISDSDGLKQNVKWLAAEMIFVIILTYGGFSSPERLEPFPPLASRLHKLNNKKMNIIDLHLM